MSASVPGSFPVGADGDRRGSAAEGLSASESAYRQLSQQIRRGVVARPSRLPAERVLARQLGVSRSTLRNALARLADEGLAESVLGSGWFVTPDVVGEPPSVLQSFTEMARSRGLTPTSTIIERSVRPAGLPEAELLKIAPGAEVLAITRLRGMDRTPICLDLSVIALPLAGPLVDQDLTDASLYEQLELHCAVRIVRSAYSVQAEVADQGLADLLRVAVGWPVLSGREVGYSSTGIPCVLGHARYRGDAYRFQADLFRS